LAYSLPLLERNIHPVVIIRAFKAALNDALETISRISQPVDISSETEMLALIKTSIGTKFSSRWSDLMCSLALQAVKTVAVTAEAENGLVGNVTGKDSGMSNLNIKTVDIKRYARVEKVPGGEIEDCRVLQGVMINKDVTHPKMRRKIANPRIVLLDCPLEYKKGESQTNIEISKEEDWNRVLQIEEEQIKAMCEKIIEFKPDLVFTEKGVSGESICVDYDQNSRSDLAQHYLLKANITALRRVRKSDNNRIARAVGATIVNRIEDLRDADVGTECGMFHIEKLGDE
jgi:T-complex protein 1 subunit gamma